MTLVSHSLTFISRIILIRVMVWLGWLIVLALKSVWLSHSQSRRKILNKRLPVITSQSSIHPFSVRLILHMVVGEI